MLYPLVLVVHVFVCFVLIAVILLQAGRGGGLTEAFGGAAQSMFGTRGALYLTRATTVCAIVFMLTSLGLAFLSAQRGHSLMAGARLPAAAAPAAPPAPATPSTEPAAQQPAAAESAQPAQAEQAPAVAPESKPSE